jgi:AGCS family alanine or glycine:cation symporter
MGGIYLIGALVVIFMNLSELPGMIWLIFHDAWTGTAAAGGFAGVTFREVLIQGMRRAVFSNEAGLGSAPIAHSAASTKEPIREGVVALLEPFVDTVVICTLTALVVLLSGAWNLDASGVELTSIAFDSAIPGFGRYFVPLAVFLFAFSTLISWSYYGERAVDYIWGDKGLLPYKILFCTVTVLGSIWTADAVLNFSDMMLGLMVVPNMFAIILLFPEVKKDSEAYFKKLSQGKFKKARQ